MRKLFLLLMGLNILSASAIAQEEKKSTTDSTSLRAFLRKGEFTGHARAYFMATDNASGLTDYQALAIGTGIGYESAKFHGFQVGLSGYFIFNLWSNNLNTIDATTGASSRYEIGNFDVTNPKNTTNLDRLEDLYLRYTLSKTSLTVGRQNLKTPFINGQDGRMRPSLEEGVWLESNELKKISLRGGWLWAMSPRSTVEWYSVGKSIGTYPVGRDIYGKPSGYAGALTSNGIGIASITYTPIKPLKWQLWHYYVDNIFQLTFSQADYQHKISGEGKAEKSIVLGVQGGLQSAVKNGGNAEASKAYIPKGSSTHFVGAKAGFKTATWETSLNFTYIGDEGRFLFPREWGIEPFYTFLPRERNEGAGNVRAVALKNELSLNKSLKLTLGGGYYDMPEVTNIRLNKYAMPSFYQINAAVNYQLGGYWKGLNLTALYVYKGRVGNIYNNRRNEINKVNMSNINIIANYEF